MAETSVLVRITPAELDGVLARIRNERRPELVLLGPAVLLPSWPRKWRPALQGRSVLQLTELVEGIEQRLLELVDLRHLILARLGIADREAEAIATHLSQLTSLSLGLNQVEDEGAEAIATHLPHLTSLDLRFNQVGDEGAKAIATHLSQLTSLSLDVNQVGDEGAKAIATHLSQLTSLDLDVNHVGAEGAKAIATHLSQLTSLSLGGNQIGVEGAKALATHLSQLTSLDLGANQVRDEGAKAIATHLSQLTSLSLGHNRVGAAGAKAIATHLSQLTSLDLGFNRVGAEGAKAIARNLPQLTSLDLGINQVGDESTKAIAWNLPQLTSLRLGGNRIGIEGAKAIATHLPQLTSLSLGGNQVGDEGAKAIATHLPQLTSLDLGGNRVGDEGAKVIATHLPQLTSLSLGKSQVGDEGVRAIGDKLGRLEFLDLRSNGAIRSATALSRVTSLRYLDLSRTSVTDLTPLKPHVERGVPFLWEQYGVGWGINVYECPLVHPRPEVVKQGRAAVLNYFRETERQGIDYLYEAKVLVVGEGGAGKTSLIRRLYYPGKPLPGEEESTRGIDIHRQQFLRSDGRNFGLNLWDFGGQLIYHATHQFFLTKSSLYVLVDDTRKDHKSVRDEGFRYWLEAVEAFGGRSPILIFQNEKGGRSKKIDEAGIKGRFPNVRETHGGNLAEPGSIDHLRRAIEHFVQELPHVGQAVPAKWVSIRAAVEEIARERPHISQDEYFDLYARHLGRDCEKALHLSRYLHDLGVFLHFQDDLRLRKTVIVQNRWATEAVFLMLDNEPIKSRLGRFSLADCARLWSSPAYADMQLELLALMEKFELCYRLQDARPDTWLVPQMLCPSTPPYVQDWAQASDLVLRYRYEFLPRGLLSRLQVRMHRYVDPQRSWANGALFEQGETQLLAHVSDRGEEITLRARGPESKALLSIIASAIDALNDSFPGLEGRVSKWIPCTCSACSQSTAPELFEQKRLLQRKRDGKQTIECPESYEDVSVLGLLDGLQVERPPSDVALPVHGNGPSPTASSFEAPRREKTIKVFLASSNETRADRDEFEIYFRQQNDRLRNQGLYIEIVRWENFLNAMSKTRLQDEYNKKVRAADLFVCLFMTKAGAYTEEEFDVAYRSFRDTGKPRIFTFFKEAQVSTSAANREGLNSLWAFQKKLDGLGHFHTTYESAAHLNLLFKDQLEKLLEQDEI